jgi:hypothetical protein
MPTPKVEIVPRFIPGVTLANEGGGDAFIVQYDLSGTPQWARRIGGTSGDTVRSVTIDSNGNIVVVGVYFSTTLTIYDTDGTTAFTTLSNAGSNDTFIVKYNSSGTPQWARQIGGTGNDQGYVITTDSNGNITVVGQYNSDTLSVFGSSASFSTLSRQGGAGDYTFVVQYNSSGTPQWARRIGGNNGGIGTGITTDSNGNIFVVLYSASSPMSVFGSSASFTSLASTGGTDSYMVKYNSSGDPQWVRQIGGSGADQMWAITTDSNGNIIVIGYYNSNTVSIYGSSASFTTLSREGSSDIFVVKYNSSGTPQWARQIGGSGADIGYGVTTDSNGNITVVGYYNSDTLSVFGSSASFSTLSNAGSNDTFVVQYNSSGTPQWARRIGGTGNEYVQTITTDSNGNIFVVGYHTSTTLTIYDTDGTTAFTTLSNAGGNDGFMVKYNSSGTPQWVRRIGGTGSEAVYGVTTNSNGNIIVAGTFSTNPLTITNQ